MVYNIVSIIAIYYYTNYSFHYKIIHDYITESMHIIFSFRLKFPSILIVYQTVALSIFWLFMLIGYTDIKTFYCDSEDLLDNTQNPTVYCNLEGV